MWNEYMEWEDDRDPITFYDEDEIDRLEEGRDPQWEDSQPGLWYNPSKCSYNRFFGHIWYMLRIITKHKYNAKLAAIQSMGVGVL